jgi:hypothetical protein
MHKTTSGSLHIAVTGHRFIPDDLNLHNAIRNALQSILKHHGIKDICLYSALAEGIDQLVAKIAREFQEIQLRVPLSMPVDEYLADFATEEGRVSFQKLLLTADQVINLSPSTSYQDSYQALGDYLVNQADILLAVWNGVYNHKKGGTGDVVKAALKAGKPVHWIYCPNEKVGAKNIFESHKQIGDLEIL